MDKIAFEAWATKDGYDVAPSVRANSEWDYQCSVTQELWWCWQAAIAYKSKE